MKTQNPKRVRTGVAFLLSLAVFFLSVICPSQKETPRGRRPKGKIEWLIDKKSNRKENAKMGRGTRLYAKGKQNTSTCNGRRL